MTSNMNEVLGQARSDDPMAKSCSTNCTHSSQVLFRRQDNDVLGRHLVATQAIGKGRLLFSERPLWVVQALDNVREAWICHGCHAFVGGPHAALRHRFGSVMADASGENETDGVRQAVVPCRDECGHAYCSAVCERDAWDAHHQWLCTGRIEDVEHPLVRFKRFAAQGDSQEILLLVAQWWVTQHRPHNSATSRRRDDNKAAPTTSQARPSSDHPISRFTDFCMNPWWDVETLGLRSQPGAFAEAFAVHERLESICKEAASLLTDALHPTFPPVTVWDVAVRAGACSQNAIGVRKRHPLCRNVFDRSLRTECRAELFQALEHAGFFCDDDNGDDDDYPEDAPESIDTGSGEDSDDGKAANSKPPPVFNNSNAAQEETVDLSPEELALFLSRLFIDEDGTVLDTNQQSNITSNDGGDIQVRDTVGDDLDYVFPPLDGTAMYSTTCKMNHSCDPNVIVLYKRSGYGSQHPLTAFCVALRDIAPGEELTISYIDEERSSYTERQQALSYYGFVCSCRKCVYEAANGGAATEVEATPPDAPAVNDDELFGIDDTDAEKSQNGTSARLNDADEPLQSSSETEGRDGELALQQVLDRLDSASNHSHFGSVPITAGAPVLSYILQTGTALLPHMTDPTVGNILSKCLDGARERDYCMCSIAGCDLELVLYHLLQKEGSWSHASLREAYWCAVLAAAIGQAHECSFLEAISLLDKGVILGLPRSNASLSTFVDYVEHHAACMSRGPWYPAICAFVPDYRRNEWKEQVIFRKSVKPIQYPIEELLLDLFQAKSLADHDKPVILRGYASEWQALDELRDLQLLVHLHGHRLLPIEIGSMMSGSMREEIMTLRRFVEGFLVPSTDHGCWSLDEARTGAYSTRVAYMAQHPLLTQISSLQELIPPQLALCGPSGPAHVNVWMGTGGTRSPLHYDSYDNFLIQLVGIKYVRLYGIDQSSKIPLRVDASYGRQGNMSSLDCEAEDAFDDCPASRSAEYTEALLFPGDCLFLPSRVWHYARSLTTSVSVNYWFEA